MKNLGKILILFFIIAGVIYNIAFVFNFEKKYPEEIELDSVVKIVSLKSEKEKSNKYIVKVINSNVKNTKNTKIILYTDTNTNLNYGDVVKIQGNFSKGEVARNYKGFSYRNYLKQSKIYGSVYCNNIIILGHETNIIEKIYKLKEKLLNTIDKMYNENESAFLKGILLGDSSNIDEEIKENFRNSSMSHVLAISGMHVAYVVLGIQFILNKFVNSRKFKNYLIICFLGCFIIITGGAASCVRACIMSSMLLISQNLYRKNNFYISFIFTFFILIFMNPYNIFAVGMWLSFFGTLGIVLFQKFLKRFIECKLKLKNKIILNILDIFLVSFSAQILILPIMIYCFNTISLTFFISNILIYFLIGPILVFGYISIIIGSFSYKIGTFLAILEKFLIFLILKIAEICSKIPFSKIYIVTPDFWMLIIYYLIIASLIFVFQIRKIKFLKIILSDFIKKFMIKNYKKIVSLLLIIVLIFNVYKVIPKNLKIYFVDVGQGDCTVIKTSGGKNIIIDGGNNQDYDYGKNVVVPYLLDRKIKNIDYLMVSHFDSDHCGGLFAVIEELNVKNIIIGKQQNKYENFEKFMKLASSKNVKINIVQAGNNINIDKYTYFQILWPIENKMFDDSNNGINNNSIVAKLVYKEFSMIFTGDIEQKAEEKIIEQYKNTNVLNCNVLKVAHHRFKIFFNSKYSKFI